MNVFWQKPVPVCCCVEGWKVCDRIGSFLHLYIYLTCVSLTCACIIHLYLTTCICSYMSISLFHHIWSIWQVPTPVYVSCICIIHVYLTTCIYILHVYLTISSYIGYTCTHECFYIYLTISSGYVSYYFITYRLYAYASMFLCRSQYTYIYPQS